MPGPRTVPGMSARTCQQCGEEITPAKTGRPARYCSQACRQAAYVDRRTRQAVAVALARMARDQGRGFVSDETRPGPGIVSDETPVSAPPSTTAPPLPLDDDRAPRPAPVPSAPRPPRPLPPPRRRSGMTAAAMPLLPFEDDQAADRAEGGPTGPPPRPGA